MLVRARGFSIIELMVVVAVLGVLAALGQPSFTSIIAANRIKTAASDIHLSLIRARSEAIKRNSNITVAAPAGWKSGWTVSNGVETHAEVPGTSITISGTEEIIYTSSGRATVNPISISLTSTDTSTARCVSVSLSGQPVVKQEACS